MKKSTLALSVIAALGGLGFAGGALAIGELGGGAATSLVLNHDGIGHQLVFPYFTAQGNNGTLINITNTDLVNGKVVKVRFRGAANSDDLFDFQVLLSPGDVWTAGVASSLVGAGPARGPATLTTTDKTCVLPSIVSAAAGNAFSTARVDPTPVKGDAANETREGYIEVISMADIPPGTDLFTAIKHVAGVAPCTAATLQARLGTDFATQALATSVAAGGGAMAAPSGGLTGDWIILNTTNTTSWSGSATALEGRIGAVRSTTNLNFWPQKDNANPLSFITATSDRMLTLVPATGLQTALEFDLPDMSTPVLGAGELTAARATATANALAVSTITNQYVTSTDINAVTDFVFSQPMRRYAVGLNYSGASSIVSNTDVVQHYNPTGAAANVVVRNRQICLNRLVRPDGKNSVFDREETTPGVAGPGGFVISPNVAPTTTAFFLCGEAAVISINAGATGSALAATVNRDDLAFTSTDLKQGWLTMATPGAVVAGLPILGGSFIRASNATLVGQTINYGFLWNHKVTRPVVGP